MRLEKNIFDVGGRRDVGISPAIFMNCRIDSGLSRTEEVRHAFLLFWESE